jgi:hypothetical protein
MTQLPVFDLSSCFLSPICSSLESSFVNVSIIFPESTPGQFYMEIYKKNCKTEAFEGKESRRWKFVIENGARATGK